ncbi:hypothetical protein NMYAN_20283 [Nitrosomonas nitrosa]|uniref:Uncharacterized protein n=1 Tax=Nitrosomonas nitrosa TaxID=52442 RepID=A0A8H8Z0C4_9PROT|nr:hypothetical protein NMYAN_20283 [Nitrosomonas nitrosa]
MTFVILPQSPRSTPLIAVRQLLVNYPVLEGILWGAIFHFFSLD